MDLRSYEESPLDEFDAWLYHSVFKVLVEKGEATAFDSRIDGKPAGYRENKRGQWRRLGVETYAPVYASQNVLHVRYLISKMDAEFFARLFMARPAWFNAWIASAMKDPDIVSDSIEPSEILDMLKTWQGAYRLLIGKEIPYNFEKADYGTLDSSDYDPLRIAMGLQPSEYIKPEIRVYAIDPFEFQTIRKYRVRNAKGQFTSETVEKKVKTLEIPHTSELGQSIRIIDVDRSRKKPRGAIARIETSPATKRRPASYAYVVPFDGKHLKGAKLEDKRHAEMRKRLEKESIQLVDHRTDKPRMFEVIVTPKSRYYSVAQNVKELVEKAQR